MGTKDESRPEYSRFKALAKRVVRVPKGEAQQQEKQAKAKAKSPSKGQ